MWFLSFQPFLGGSGPILFYNKDQPYYEFTNFAYYPIFVDENLFQTSEHYFQSQKLVGTPYENHVSQLPTPRDAFEFPRQPHVALWVREDWQRVKEDVMYKALYHKFDQYLELKEILLKTGDRKLVEHSPYDSYWGDGPDGKGLNRLGVLLMKLRDAYSGKHTSKIDQSGSNVQFDDTNKEQTETAENTPSPSNQTQSATSCTYANISENPNSEALITAPPNHLDNGQGSNQNPNGIKEIATSTTNEQQPSEQSPSCDPPNHLDNDQGVPISELDTSQGSSLTVPEPLRNDQNLNNFQNQQHPSTNQNPNNIEEIATNTTNEQQPSEQFPSNDPPDFLDKGQVVPTSEADSFQGSSSTVPGTLQNDHFLIDFQDQQHPSTNQNPNNIREIPTSTTNKQQQPSEQFPLYYDPNTHIIPTIGTTVPHSTDLDLQQQNQHYSNLGCDHLGSATNYSDIPQTGTGSDITCAEHCHVTQTTDRQSSEQSFSDREELPRGDDSSSERENGFAMDIDAPADPDEQMDTSENATQTCL